MLLSDCDTVANIDFKDVFRFHSEKEADITVIYRHGASPDTDKNVVYTVDPEGFVRDMLVKRGSDAGLQLWHGYVSDRPQKADGAGRRLHEPQPVRF